MRDNIIGLIVLTGVFFGIGEWRGWNIGLAGQTPIFVYKKVAQSRVVRRVRVEDSLPFHLNGQIKNGDLTVKGFFKTAANFETSAREGKEKLLFKQNFVKGQKIDLEKVLRAGKGIYIIELDFHETTGLFNLKVKKAAKFNPGK